MPNNPDTRKFPLGIFLLGMLAGIAVVFLFLFFVACIVFSQITTGSFFETKLFSSVTEQVRRGVLESERRAEATSLHGQITALDQHSITLEGRDVEGAIVRYTFEISAETTVIQIANDDAATKIPIRPEDLSLSEWVTVEAGEPLEEGKELHALEIVRI